MKIEERKEATKFKLNREDSPNNSRLAWLLTFQGFLFATYAFSVDPENSRQLGVQFSTVVIFLGAFSAAISWVLVALGALSIYRLHQLWDQVEPDTELSPFGLQLPGMGYLTNLLGLSQFLPVACLVAWAVSAGWIAM